MACSGCRVSRGAKFGPLGFDRKVPKVLGAELQAANTTASKKTVKKRTRLISFHRALCYHSSDICKDSRKYTRRTYWRHSKVRYSTLISLAHPPLNIGANATIKYDTY